MNRRSRDSLPHRFPVVGGLLLGVAFLVSLPLTLPIAIFQHQCMLKHMRAAAERFVCEQCAATLGVAALRLGDARWDEMLQQRRASMLRLRIVRDLHALCASCGAEYVYDQAGNTFRRRQPGAAPI